MRLTSEESIKLAEIAIKMYNEGHVRLGQAYMNALHKISPDLYNEVSQTDADCFYNDDKMVQFTEFINGKNFSKHE